MAGPAYIGQVFPIPVGQGGLVGTKDQAEISPDRLIVARNLSFEGRTLRKEGGAAKYNSTAITGAPTILGGWDWWPTDGVQRMVVAASDGAIPSRDVDSIDRVRGLAEDRASIGRPPWGVPRDLSSELAHDRPARDLDHLPGTRGCPAGDERKATIRRDGDKVSCVEKAPGPGGHVHDVDARGLVVDVQEHGFGIDPDQLARGLVFGCRKVPDESR